MKKTVPVRTSIILSVVSLLATSLLALAEVPLPPSRLRCEYLEDPMGIDVSQPRFYWRLEHPDRDQGQAAYQILVSTQPTVQSGDQWDSGKVKSESPVHIVYTGKPLGSNRTFYWKVRYWDRTGEVSPYSPAAHFDTGLFSPSDWKGRWIGGANQLRREFMLVGKPVRARVFISGIGYSELRINGKKIGQHVLDPAWTPFDKRVLYSTYDVTDQLLPGKNAIAVMLGEGKYGSRALMFQLLAELAGGQQASIASDTSWKTKAGPITSDSVYNGESYDARLETPGWDLPGYDDSGWTTAVEVKPPQGVLSAQMMPAIEVVDTIVPLKMTNPQPGVYVYDMGQNFSGWAQLRVSGPRGTTVKLRFAELLYGDGMINTENLRAAKAMDTYTLKGSGTEVYEPRFTYHGFRYVELTGFSGTPRLDTLRGRVVHTAVQPTGGFICSKPILNQLQHIILWGQTTNLHSIPTDCDQRDERLGWLGDAHVTAEEAMMNYDMAAFYTNFLRDIRDEQDSEGALPDVIPGAQYGLRPADPAWGSAYPLITWYMYQRYGDRRILETHYEGIKAWADSLSRKAENHILSFSKYGDWVPIEKTPNSVTSTFYYAYGNEVVAKAAEVLGKPDEAQKYRSLASDIKAAFHKKFYDPANEYYATGTQSANTFALFLNMVPEENRGAVMGYLTNNIVYSHDTHVTTGFLGIKYLMEVLTQEGRSDLAYELATQASYPSWGYMMENGATTLWELWQNKTGPSMNSHNHPMFGSVGCWLYQALGGINLDAKEVGYRRIRIAPQMVRDLTWASATVETVRGVVSSEWQRTADRIHLEILIPVGSNAQVLIPKLQMARVNVTEGGKAVWQKGAFQSGVPGIRSAKDETESIVLEVGSGHYSFEIVEEWPSM